MSNQIIPITIFSYVRVVAQKEERLESEPEVAALYLLSISDENITSVTTKLLKIMQVIWHAFTCFSVSYECGVSCDAN